MLNHPFPEHVLVRVRQEITADGVKLLGGQRGTIVSVNKVANAYTIEFLNERGSSFIASLSYNEVVLA